MLLASIVARLGGPPVVTDWIEVWSRDYWDSYLGRYAGWIGGAVQRLCIRSTRQAFTFADSTAAMLCRAGYRGKPVVLRGMFAGTAPPFDPGAARLPLVVFAGRHIREKQVRAIPGALALARTTVPELRAVIFGDGPERAQLLADIADLRLADAIDCPGFVEDGRVEETLGRALGLLLPSEREGYGLAVLEAAARGTPAILVKGEANAAADFIADGVNGYLAPDAGPAALARAILRVHADGAALRQSTAAWFARHEAAFRIESSIARVEQAYRAAVGGASTIRK